MIVTNMESKSVVGPSACHHHHSTFAATTKVWRPHEAGISRTSLRYDSGRPRQLGPARSARRSAST